MNPSSKPPRDVKVAPARRIITLDEFRDIETALRARGFGAEIDAAGTAQPPTDAAAFALEVIYVIVNSGMAYRIAAAIYERCLAAVERGDSATSVFGHPKKAAAIDAIWGSRHAEFARFLGEIDKLAFCATLPYIGPVTKFHLAKNLGGNFVKPDVHIARLAAAEGVSAWDMCHRLAIKSGYTEAKVDTILWRACVERLVIADCFQSHAQLAK